MDHSSDHAPRSLRSTRARSTDRREAMTLQPPPTDELTAAVHDDTLPLPARLEAARTILRLLDEAKRSIGTTVSEMVQTQQLDSDMIATLYWEYEDLVPSTMLGQYHLIREIVVERCPWTYPCPDCGRDMPITSRTKLRELQSAMNQPKKQWLLGTFRCSACDQARSVAREEEYRRDAEQYQRRLRELRTMPYKDYLLTPEWQERRRARLKAARYRCQVCNTKNERLNVHHRTYERRGAEYARDLIVLCEGCHYLFHRNGSLAPHGD